MLVVPIKTGELFFLNSETLVAIKLYLDFSLLNIKSGASILNKSEFVGISTTSNL